ncbi:MAG: hypothetical protein ATN36_03960 [Epulopiscium sp. Nele67-Bin005]|nr:MAG: hypothetical protein ATN36_03960 [Epulopiscium sp. Nele67-Bin005]
MEQDLLERVDRIYDWCEKNKDLGDKGLLKLKSENFDDLDNTMSEIATASETIKPVYKDELLRIRGNLFIDRDKYIYVNTLAFCQLLTYFRILRQEFNH